MMRAGVGADDIDCFSIYLITRTYVSGQKFEPNIIMHHTFMRREPLLGPVVQSIVSLTSSLSGQLVKCFTTL